MSVSIYKDGKLTPVAGALQTSLSPVFPGQITMGANNTAPYGWLLCDGTAYLNTDFPELFKAIGKTYDKPGTPANKFCVPDMRGRYIMGADGTNPAGSNIAESLPNIKGNITSNSTNNAIQGCNSPKFDGAYKDSKTGSNAGWSGNVGYNFYLNFNAHNSNPIYQDGAKVRPDSLVLNYYIKY